MYLAVLLAFLSISCRASFVGHSPPNSPLTGRHALGESIEYNGSGESSKEPVLESIVTKRGVDPLSIPQLIREPPLKRGDKRDSYVYPSTSSKLSDRVPLREPPLKRQEYFELSNLFSPSEKIVEWQDTTDENSGEGKSNGKHVLLRLDQ
ncbi:hypothetical protein NECAME_08885 [Necator americanus]|uniref:Uncharacterized protein n=1 Tax=Necator americanus TaxID=51031 RepID=W2TG72_NECAM|nr:hypothetical protein NECAME_08885 [Necator americanus]ETN80808.1 hypothetical protein NECAME_08885 [Necator americanus]